MRPRYFKPPEDNKVFDWLGSPISRPKEATETKIKSSGDHIYYETFSLGGIKVDVGDYVLVNSDGVTENLLDCDVARVQFLYQDDDNKSDPYRAVVEWFCRPAFLPTMLKKKHGFEEEGAPDYSNKSEVLVEARNFEIDISAETIYFKCNVKEGDMLTNPDKFCKAKSVGKIPTYLLRFKMVKSGRKYIVAPIVEPERKSGKTPRSSNKKLKDVEIIQSPGGRAASPVIPPRNGRGRNPLKERTDNSRDSSGSPEIPLIDNPKKFTLLNLPLRINVSQCDSGKKRKPSSSAENTPAKKKKESKSMENSPEMNDFVTNTPKNRNSKSRNSSPTGSLDGGYWGEMLEKKRTPKPKKPLDADMNTSSADLVKTRTRRSSSSQFSSTDNTPSTPKQPKLSLRRAISEKKMIQESSELPRRTRRNSSVSTESFTEVNCVSDSGRKKIKIRCGSESRSISSPFTRVEIPNATDSGRKLKINVGSKVSKSKNMKDSDIFDILDSQDEDDDLDIDSDLEDKEVVKEVKGISKLEGDGNGTKRRSRRLSESLDKPPLPLERSRRKSSSCTTPVKSIAKSTARKSLTDKKSRRSSSNVSSSDDFTPIKSKKKVDAKKSKTSDKKIVKKPVSSTKKSAKPVKKPSSATKKAVRKLVESESVSSDSPDPSSESEFSGDEEAFSPKKKKLVRPKKDDPTTVPRTPKRVFKPGVASRKTTLPASLSPIAAAQQRLHVSAVPESLVCRDDEFAEIHGFIDGKLREGGGGCMYISGVPGTGKTATVNEVIRYLKEDSDTPDFTFHEINGMRLTSPEQTYTEMWRLLTGQKMTPDHAMQLLDRRFSTPTPRRVATVFLVDELDMLMNRKQSVLYNMFSWPSREGGKLIILCIANTMDLPEKVMMNRVSSRIGLTRHNFQPYTFQQLEQIVLSRLEGLELFKTDAIQLVARKVAGLSGDARRALDICRRSTEMAEAEGTTQIGLKHMMKAYDEMFTSPKIMAIRSCSKYEQKFLQVIVSDFYKSGIEETTLGRLYSEFQSTVRFEGFPILSLCGTIELAARLSAQKIIIAEHFRGGLDTKIRLNVSVDTVNFALQPRKD